MLRGLALLLLCEASLFTAVTPVKVCGRPPEVENAQLEDERRVYEAGEEVFYTCLPGYAIAAGSRKSICTLQGTWSQSKLKCKPKSCSVPGPLANGRIRFASIHFKSTINFTCDEGYVLHGEERSHCQHDGTWSPPLPVCQAVTCGLPGIPQYGRMIHTKMFSDNTTQFGDTVRYDCSPPYVLFGSEIGTCQANGNWTEMPECRVVTCPYPPKIQNGFMQFAVMREHGYQESIKYGCNPEYFLDGPSEIRCEKTGSWSVLPVCRASCIVGIQRGRIFYNAKKIWIEDLPQKKVQHSDHVAFYCKNKEKNCGYPVVTQCFDGTLKIPECFEEPSAMTYKFQSKKLPSEIQMC